MMERVSVVVMLFLCVVCDNMGVCYFKLSQLDAAEEAFSQSLAIKTVIFPPGNDSISISETIVIVVTNEHQACCFCS